MGFSPTVLCFLLLAGEEPVGLCDEETVDGNKLFHQTSTLTDGYLYGKRVSSK